MSITVGSVRVLVQSEQFRAMQNAGYADKEYLEHHARNTVIGRTMRKWHAQGQESAVGQWEIPYRQNKLMLMFLILIHVFFADDGVISKKEERVIRKIGKESRGILTPDHYEQVLTFIDKLPTEQDVIRYIEGKQFKPETIKEAVKELLEHIRYDKRYYGLVKNTVKALLPEEL